jgi:hypothetical protein
MFLQTCLRHPDCPSARENRDTVFCQMRRAMDLIHYVVKDGVLDSVARLGDAISPMDQHCASEVSWSLLLYHSAKMCGQCCLSVSPQTTLADVCTFSLICHFYQHTVAKCSELSHYTKQSTYSGIYWNAYGVVFWQSNWVIMAYFLSSLLLLLSDGYKL